MFRSLRRGAEQKMNLGVTSIRRTTVTASSGGEPGRGQPSRPAVADADRGSGRDVHAVALEAAGAAIRLAMKVPAPLKAVTDQAIRSAVSVPANVVEGHSRTGRERGHLWRIAYGSAKEVDSHLRLLIAAGAVNRVGAEEALKLVDRVRAMTCRLLHPAT